MVRTFRLWFWIASGAESFKLYALAFDYNAFAWAFCHRRRYLGKTTRPAAVCAGEVWVALGFGAVVGKFEMPSSFMYIGLMHQSCGAEAFQGAIDSSFINAGFC